MAIQKNRAMWISWVTTVTTMAVIALTSAARIVASDFTLTIGSPIAVMPPATAGAASGFSKGKFLALFVVRGDNCPQPVTEIVGTAEGVVNGSRRSMPLTLVPVPDKPGVFGARKTWTEGAWVATLVGSCREVKAGAIVPIKGDAFVRETTRFFPRPATAAEIDESLKALR